MLDITFRQLDVFVRIVEGGSFRSAADELSISQVSVSTHVKALETHLGVELFERKRGTTGQLTQVGEATYKRAKELLRAGAELASVRCERPKANSDAAISLRIAAHGYIAERFSRALAEFKSLHPEIELELERRPFEGVLQGMRKPDIEIGLFLARGPVPQLKSTLISREELAFYVARTHPLADRDVVSPSEFSQYPFCYLPQSSHLSTQVNALLAEVGLRDCPIALVSDDHMLVSESLTDGKSVACLFKYGTDSSRFRRLKRLNLDRRIPPMEVRYTVRTELANHAAVRMLADHLSATAANAH